MNSNTLKKVTSFMSVNVDGIDKIIYTFSEIDGKTGKEIIGNEKRNFYVVDDCVAEAVKTIRDHILDSQLSEEG
ncbi:MAG: hypothetical protein HFI66_00865 [Lachnospiraceae bacterium]|jgi:general stress protein 26|nr:hypothetical protein [Lachnospiraceae bacterium]